MKLRTTFPVILSLSAFQLAFVANGAQNEPVDKPPVAKWILEFETSPDPRARARAVEEIQAYEEDVAVLALPSLIKSLEFETSHLVLERVLSGLHGLKKNAKPAAEPVALFLSKASLDEAEWCLYILRDLGQDATVAVPSIIAEFQRRTRPQSIGFRRMAVKAIMKIDPSSNAADDFLQFAVCDQDDGVKVLAAANLWRLTTTDEEKSKQLKVVCEHTANPNRDIRWIAIEELGLLGSKSKLSVDSVLYCLTDSDSQIRCEAIQSLTRIGVRGPKIISKVESILADKDWFFRARASQWLGECGSSAGAAVPSLQRLASDSDWFVRIDSAIALWRIDRNNAVETKNVLLAALKCSDEYARSHAARSLGELPLLNEGACRALLDAMLRDTQKNVRSVAAASLVSVASRQAVEWTSNQVRSSVFDIAGLELPASIGKGVRSLFPHNLGR